MSAPPPKTISEQQIGVMLDAIKRDAEQYFDMGRMVVTRDLPNGYRVRVEIRQRAPKKPAKKGLKK